MKQVTITLSDDDFETLLGHFVKDRIGKPLVAVQSIVAVQGDQTRSLEDHLADLDEEQYDPYCDDTEL